MLLIIIDDLPHETLWRLWAEQYDMDSTNGTVSANAERDGDFKQTSNSREPLAADVIPEQPSPYVSALADAIPNPGNTSANTPSLSQKVSDTSDLKASISPVRFLIHAKFPDRVRSGWVRDRLVSFHLKPGWGSLELTEVMIRMLDEASKWRDYMIGKYSTCTCFITFDVTMI